MPLESATYISDLVVTNPANSDGLNQADDHMRLIKATLQNTLPGATVPLTRGVINGPGLLAGTGSVSAPGYAFNQRPDLGFYGIDFTVGKDLVGFAGVLRGNGMCPPGAIMDFGMASAPVGWLACDGQAVSRTTYSDLFGQIGTTWGAGDGSTTFNVPALINRFRRNRDNAALAGAVGNLQNPLNLAHTHAVSVSGNTGTESVDHTHTYSGTTSSMNRNNPHAHTGAFTSTAATAQNAVNGSLPINWSSVNTGSTDINHEHTFSGTTSGISTTHTHFFSAGVTSGGGSADGAEARPYCATVLTCIKI